MVFKATPKESPFLLPRISGGVQIPNPLRRISLRQLADALQRICKQEPQELRTGITVAEHLR